MNSVRYLSASETYCKNTAPFCCIGRVTARVPFSANTHHVFNEETENFEKKQKEKTLDLTISDDEESENGSIVRLSHVSRKYNDHMPPLGRCRWRRRE
jgi:hypothetical protein